MFEVTAEEVRTIRRLLGWTQLRLAQTLGYPYAAQVSQWERGLAGPGPAARKRLAEMREELRDEGRWPG